MKIKIVFVNINLIGERMNKKKNGLLIFRIMSLIIIIICLIVLYVWNQSNKENENMQEELTNYAKIVEISKESGEDAKEIVEENSRINLLEVNFEELKNKNSDTVAWVKLENTNIDYPVVQAKDNNYYLKRNFERKNNGAGWIFADYRNNFEQLNKNIVIYGHNRRNGSMFSNLKELLKENWFEDESNKFFYFTTPQKSYIAQIFSVYMVKAKDFSIPTHFEDDVHHEQYLANIKDISSYKFNVEIGIQDNIVTLCTCGNNINYRILVHAKLIEE